MSIVLYSRAVRLDGAKRETTRYPSDAFQKQYFEVWQ